MIRKRFGRVATAITTAALLGVLTVAAPASAKVPGWQFLNVQQLPSTVADGGIAGFSFRIFNNGKSNISALYLTDSVVAAPLYLTTSRGTAGCQTTPDLRCAFGALNSKAWIDVTIAYRVGTANFTNTFQLDSTGDPAGGNNSHGDSLKLPLTTAVNSSQNFDGGFAIGASTYETGGSLGNSNKQTTKLETADALIPVTVEDGVADGDVPCPGSDPDCAAASLIGEWSVLNVNGGATGQPIKVTIMIWGGVVPSSVHASDIYLLHADGLGGATAVTVHCNASPPTNADCLESVTKVGGNFRIVAWLAHNGAGHGAF